MIYHVRLTHLPYSPDRFACDAVIYHSAADIARPIVVVVKVGMCIAAEDVAAGVRSTASQALANEGRMVPPDRIAVTVL